MRQFFLAGARVGAIGRGGRPAVIVGRDHSFYILFIRGERELLGAPSLWAFDASPGGRFDPSGRTTFSQAIGKSVLPRPIGKKGSFLCYGGSKGLGPRGAERARTIQLPRRSQESRKGGTIMRNHHQWISLAEAQRPFFVGVDLGGTNVKVGLVDDLGRTLAYRSIATEADRGPEDATRRMAQAVRETIAEAGLQVHEVARVGLGSPGTMDIPGGYLIQPVNLKGWDGYPIRDKLAEYCGLPVSFENDANAAAYGEYWVGSGRAYHSMVLLTLGTGIGCGIIIGDMVLRGENSHGAECGHIIIDCRDDALICGCGQPGHLEAYASATGVIRRTQAALADSSRATSLRERLAKGEELSPLMLAQEAEKGDQFSLEMILDTARYLGIGIVSLMHTIDPNCVLLGGAMTFGGRENPVGRQFLARIKQEIDRRAFSLLAERIVLDFAALGSDAGYIGAAGIARLEYQRLPQR